MKKHNQILSIILVLQIALAAIVFWPRQNAAGVESALLLGELETGDIVALSIEDDEGNRIEMRQTAGVWAIPNAGDFAVQAESITELVEKLVAIDTSRLVTRTDSSHQRLQVASDDFVRRITLETADGESQTLYLGSSPSYGATHIRLQGKDETYLTSELSSWEVNATASSWVDTQYLSINREDVTTITLQNRNGDLAFDKDSEGNWTLIGLGEEEALNSGNVNSLVSQVTSINLSQPLGKEENDIYQLDEPNAIVTVTTAEKTITILVGSKYMEDNSYVVKSSESPYFVRVNEFSVKDLVEKSRDDFIQPPATPTTETSQ